VSNHALDLSDYGIGAQILRDVGIGTLRLLTTNPDKVEMLERYELSVADQILPEA
jgi:3,4-dihydroxy 2-butanone 4-phosphate synthase/GTP cyclohydrolase II